MDGEIEVATEGAELATEGTEEVEQGSKEVVEGAEQVEGAEETESEEPKSAAETWKQVKDRLKDAPDLHRQVKKALHFMEDANRRMPDGIAKAAERLELISQLDDNPDDPDYVAGSTPIEDVISNTLSERTFWRDFDNAFQSGDPKLIPQMVEANPEAFQKLIPLAMDQFAQVNPEGFSAYVCKSVAGYLNQAQIPLQLALLDRVLPPDSDDPSLKTVIEAFKSIKGVIEQINSGAKSPILPKSVQKQENGQNQNTGESSLEQREMNVLHDEWLRDIRPRSESLMVSEVKRISPTTKFTQSEVKSIRSAVAEEINARVSANKGYQNRVASLLKAKNKTAYAMTVESEHKKIIPGAIKRAVDDVLAKRKTSAGKKVVSGGQQGQKQAAQIQQGSNDQYEMISASPTRLGLKIDFHRGGIQPNNTAYIIGRSKPVKWRGGPGSK